MSTRTDQRKTLVAHLTSLGWILPWFTSSTQRDTREKWHITAVTPDWPHVRVLIGSGPTWPKARDEAYQYTTIEEQTNVASTRIPKFVKGTNLHHGFVYYLKFTPHETETHQINT